MFSTVSRDYVIIQSSDEHEFILSRRVAEYCEKFKKILKITDGERKDLNTPPTINTEIRAEHLEIIIQYLHYKNRWINQDIAQIPKFEIPGPKALEVLKAATSLNL